MAKKPEKSQLIKDMDEIIENGEIGKYIDEHLVVIATCRLSCTSEIISGTLYLDEFKFDKIHLNDCQYFLHQKEVHKTRIIAEVKELLKEEEKDNDS